MKLIVLSPSKNREHEPQTVTDLFEHGLEIFHLRKPTMSISEMRRYIREIPAHFHERIVIHSHHRLAGEFGLKGIHLTRKHLQKPISTWFRIRRLKLRSPELTVSTTFTRLGDIYENKKSYDYVLLGTIFDNVSGNFNAGYSQHSLEAAFQKTAVPLIARGGTSVDNLQTCHSLGFAGVIFYGGIWKHEDAVKAFTTILTHCRELNIPY
jgi:thiamine-phosphate pyrophosphorylase